MPCLAILITTTALAAGLAAAQEKPMDAIQDKTLVAWVALANTTQRAGSALTLDDQASHFDGIIFGERTPGKWMAGSDGFRRSEAPQDDWPLEAAAPGTVLKMAVTYRGSEITLYRDGALYARYTVPQAQAFGPGCAAVMGLRHLEAGDRACLAGVIKEARLYDRALTAQEVAALTPGTLEPGGLKPVAWWDFTTASADDRMGRFPRARLFGDAHVDAAGLHLGGRESFLVAAGAQSLPDLRSPVHFRPMLGRFADPIPFYWKGDTHVFYLIGSAGPCNWEHLVSTDLVHWRELPTALRPDPADAEGPDGGCMFTGSVTEHDGLFHIFYTGHNPRNPAHTEVVMHATSPDLVTWTKHPQHQVAPDGVHYAGNHDADFRDPYVFWNPEEKRHWMVVIARDPKTNAAVQGLLTSADLIHWQQEAPLLGVEGQECPDLFTIGDTHYLIGGGYYSWSHNWRGPYQRPPVCADIDRPNVYAAKRTFDGRRHIWTGWIWDRADGRDAGDGTWGGTQCLPRELYPGPGGQLYCKPVDEVVAVYNRTVLTVAKEPAFTLADATWRVEGGVVQGPPLGSQSRCSLPVPADYLLDCRLKLTPTTRLTVALREQADTGEAYRLVLDVARGELTLGGGAFTFRRPCPVDASAPVKLQVFVQGTIIEAFVNDQYAQTCRAYDLHGGRLGLGVAGGPVTMSELAVRVPGGG